ncbi:MAG: ribosome recycling factor [Parcubacteria group bacterium]|nr:ribosome recycling factor [Parcubacteria group bacterium]
MQYDFSTFKTRSAEVAAWLKTEFAGIHTGRATPSLLDKVMIDSYDAKTPIQHVASISVENARSLRIVPWDKKNIKEIEKAIGNAKLGVNVSIDDQGVRVSFPELTSENRQMLVKLARAKLEDARVTLKKEREEVWNDIQKKEREGEIPEDDKFRFKDELQKLIDTAHKELEAIIERKEKEIIG